MLDLKLAKARLLRRRSPIVADDCWIWPGAASSNGYGRVRIDKEYYFVHRVAAAIWLGLDLNEAGKQANHHCDKRRCFNPQHLWIGSQSENLHDMVAKGRCNRIDKARGERHGRAKLSARNVKTIRRNSTLTQDQLARQFKVSRMQIRRILSGQHWTHIKVPRYKGFYRNRII